MKNEFNLFIFILFYILISILDVKGQVDTLWAKKYVGTDQDRSYAVQQTAEGGYVIIGTTESFGAGNSDVWLIKTNSFGNILWTKTFGGTQQESGYSGQQTLDGGYIITGYTNSFGVGESDVWLIKTDSFGDTIWTKTFGGSSIDYGASVQQTIDGGYVIAGYTYSFGVGNCDAWLIKTDSLGNALWIQTYGGAGEDYANSVEQTIDGGYIITGDFFGPAGSHDIWLIKTDTSGDTLWTKTFGGVGNDNSFSVCQTSEGGYIIAGNTESFGAVLTDVLLIKTDAFGDTLWTKTFGWSGYDVSFEIQRTADSGYIIVGATDSQGDSDALLIKINSSGDSIWTEIFDAGNFESTHSIYCTTDGGYIICGRIVSPSTNDTDVWLIKTTSDISDIALDTDLMPVNFFLSQNYPNPFNPSTSIRYEIPEQSFVTLKVYDILGIEIATLVNEEKSAGSYEVEFSAKGGSASGGNAYSLPSGVYFYTLSSDNYLSTKKMILLK
jgi:hypothetical protein